MKKPLLGTRIISALQSSAERRTRLNKSMPYGRHFGIGKSITREQFIKKTERMAERVMTTITPELKDRINREGGTFVEVGAGKKHQFFVEVKNGKITGLKQIDQKMFHSNPKNYYTMYWY